MQKYLEIAESYYKKKDWKKALQYYTACYEDMINEFSEDEYVKFAKVLNRVGDTSKAEDVLKIAYKSFPGEIKIVNEQYSLYSSILNWNEAEKCALKILELDEHNPDSYFKLGKVYYFMEEREKAENAYMQGLELKHDVCINDLMKNIQKEITENIDEVSTTYEFISGENNLGSFVHAYKDKKYFTKISKTSSTKKYEVPFYEKIRENSPDLKKITPNLIHVQNYDGLCYLTTEKRDIEPTSIDDIEDVIRTSNMISSIPYNGVEKLIKKESIILF